MYENNVDRFLYHEHYDEWRESLLLHYVDQHNADDHALAYAPTIVATECHVLHRFASSSISI
jgi:hypothetical protein